MTNPLCPAVSVVLPTYNGSRYLAESMQSVIDQTFTDWELIIVDDCSTDETPDIIERFVRQDPRIRSIRHDTNRKLPAALNTGFADARAEYFTWTSDDNLFRPAALEVMHHHLGSNSNADVVYCDRTDINADGSPRGYQTVEALELIADKNPIGACFMYRRRVQEMLGGYAEDLHGAEDYDFWLRASYRVKFQPIHTDLYLYRIHDDALTVRSRERVSLSTLEALSRSVGRLDWLPRPVRARRLLALARSATYHRDVRLVRRCLGRAARCHWITALRADRLVWAVCLLGRWATRLQQTWHEAGIKGRRG